MVQRWIVCTLCETVGQLGHWCEECITAAACLYTWTKFCRHVFYAAPNNHKFRHDSHQTSALCYVRMHLSTDVFTAVVAFFLQSADLKQMYAQSEWFNQIKVCISRCVTFVGVSCIIWFTLTRHHSLAALAVLAKMLFKKMFFRMCNCLITPQVLIVCTLLLSAGVYICLLFVLVRRCLSAIFGKVVTKGSPLKWTVC